MIDRREILDSATTASLSPQVVEKDYVLGWLLAGIQTGGSCGRLDLQGRHLS